MFAFDDDAHTVAAITIDGATAWTAAIGASPITGVANSALPDFQGGLVVLRNNNSIVKLDGITGQPGPAYAPGGGSSILAPVIHPDGTIFALQSDPIVVGGNHEQQSSVIGIDPVTGTLKFSVLVPFQFGGILLDELTIAGDGYAYAVYITSADVRSTTWRFMLLRVDVNGNHDSILLAEVPGDPNGSGARIGLSPPISNGDTGVVVTFGRNKTLIANVTNGSAVVGDGPAIPGEDDDVLTPVLQMQDGSFVGTAYIQGILQMVAFDASGTVRWSVPNEQPQIATSSGGVIGQSGTYCDQNGNATWQFGTLPAYSWKGAYLAKSIASSVIP
jgi:hypothetical protein